MEDTICAIATALGVGAISIIRISGQDAIKIVSKIFDGPNLNKKSSHTINYGYIIDEKEQIDEVLVTIMKAPKTFTKEDVIEINCHGGVASVNKILELLLNNGCRLAEPGEFTKRAFLNGRIDLLEAEAVGDLIAAQTQNARGLAINQLQGSLTKIIDKIRNDLITILGHIEVNIDYPEYDDIEVLTEKTLKNKLDNVIKELNELLNGAQNGKYIKDGINVAIIGRPNVGKSSVLNHLLEEEKAIVTDIAGTTRDIVEGKFILNGIIFNLIDTAGIRKSADKIEKIGIDKSYQELEKAQLIILVLNNNELLNKEDKTLLTKIKNKNAIVLINKIDLESKINEDQLNNNNVVYGNTVDSNGLDELKKKIIEIFNLEKINNNDLTYLSNARQISLVKKALNNIEKTINNLNKVPIDMLTIDIKDAFDTLGEIVGKTYKNELLDEIFSKFCLGK